MPSHTLTPQCGEDDEG